MYNPNNISPPEIVYGDHPYAGVLYLNHSLISSDIEKKQKLTTELDVGVIGKYSFADQPVGLTLISVIMKTPA